MGSVTLGICLITAGIFFLAYHFLPNFDALLVLKIVPAAGLVLLGCEVLYYATRPQRGRYDFVSVFVCLVLMACCFGLTLLPLVWEQVNPEVQQQEQKLRDAYQQSVYEKFQQEASDIRLKDMGCWVELYGYHNDVEKLTPDNTETLGLNVWLQGPYDSAEAFAKDCRRLTNVVQQMEVQPKQIGFFCRDFRMRTGTCPPAVWRKKKTMSWNWTAPSSWTGRPRKWQRPPMWSRCSRKRMSSDCSLRKTPVPSLAGGKAPEA